MQTNMKIPRGFSKKILCVILCLCFVISIPGATVSAVNWSIGQEAYINTSGCSYNFHYGSNGPYYKIWIANTGSATLKYTVWRMIDPSLGRAVHQATVEPGQQILYYGGEPGGGAYYQISLTPNNINTSISCKVNVRIGSTQAELG